MDESQNLAGCHSHAGPRALLNNNGTNRARIGDAILADILSETRMKKLEEQVIKVSVGHSSSRKNFRFEFRFVAEGRGERTVVYEGGVDKRSAEKAILRTDGHEERMDRIDVFDLEHAIQNVIWALEKREEKREGPSKAQLMALPLNVTLEGAYPTDVDYDVPLERLARELPRDYVSDTITSIDFPTERQGKGKVVIELAKADRDVFYEEVAAAIDALGYRPAEVHEFVSLANEHHEAAAFSLLGLSLTEKETPLEIRGEVPWGDCRFYMLWSMPPGKTEYDNKGSLSIQPTDLVIDSGFRFPVVRK